MAIRSSNSDPTLARAVGFASVQIREYPRILGDNPSVTSGPPITLSWEYDDEAGGRCSIDEWEGQRCRERRTREEFRVPEAIRTGWVLSAGHSTTEIRDIVLDIQKEKKVRRYSMDRSSLGDKADVMAESVKRRLARAVGKREKSDALYTKWVAELEGRRRVSLPGGTTPPDTGAPHARRATVQ